MRTSTASGQDENVAKIRLKGPKSSWICFIWTNCEFYSGVIKHGTRPECCDPASRTLLHDNVLAHVFNTLLCWQSKYWSYPVDPLVPYLIPTDFFLFLKLALKMKTHILHDISAFRKSLQRMELKEIPYKMVNFQSTLKSIPVPRSVYN